jgi:hypothetical protein
MASDVRKTAFDVWAAADAKWSAWAKPVLFSHLSAVAEQSASPAIEELNLEQSDGRTALVIDLPAVQAIGLGLAVAAKGYRPVPLFNALPGPSFGGTIAAPTAAVDLWPAMNALLSGAEVLSRRALPANASPAFLLDANRRGKQAVSAGDFDNRSISLTTDFPSAATLGGAGISQIVLISENRVVAADLAHTLLRWQNSGLVLYTAGLALDAQSLIPLRVARPSGFGLMFQRLLAAVGLRSSPFGGFGAMLPIPSSG